MSTWHQDKNPQVIAALWKPHATHWKCISDKPGKPASCMTFDNAEQAKAYAEKTGDILISPERRE